MNNRLAVLCLTLSAASFIHAVEAPKDDPAPPVVSNIKVLSDKVEDVSSIEAWQKAVIKDGMSDEKKALAAFDTVVKYRHHDGDAKEYLPPDAIKQFNVYGYGGAKAPMLLLARSLGLEARGYDLAHWGGGSEVKFDHSWHFLDPGLICYFLDPQGKIYSVEEISKDVKAWYAANPDYMEKVDKLKAYMKDPGMKKGPQTILNCPTMNERGSYSLDFFGWYTAMYIFSGWDNTPRVYEDPYSAGYRVNIQLRPGEKLTRNWAHKNMHINMNGDGGEPGVLKAKVGTGMLLYAQKMGDLSNGRIGNGTHEYTLPVSQLAGAAAADGSRTINIRMPSSYVYLSGELASEAKLGEGGEIAVLFSDNNGLDYKEVGKLAAGKQTLDLKPHVFRRYDYRLRLVLKGKDTSLDALKITHDIQHSQRPLPALGEGENKIAFSAGPDEGTVTIEGATTEAKGKQVTFEEFHAALDKISPESLKKWGTFAPAGPNCSVTYPVEAPGDIVRLRMGCNYRARDAADAWEFQVSFDDGKTFKTIDKAAGPYPHNGKFITYADIPAGTRKLLVRYAGTQKAALVMFAQRINADYKQPNGKFAPVKITYTWTENGQEKQDVHIAKTSEDKYTIKCAAKPTMKSIVLELAE
jgi:hypothetical protein